MKKRLVERKFIENTNIILNYESFYELLNKIWHSEQEFITENNLEIQKKLQIFFQLLNMLQIMALEHEHIAPVISN